MVGLEFDDFDFIGSGSDGSNLDSGGIVIEKPCISNIVPCRGMYLGLDVSKNSTGVCIISDGVLSSSNICLEDIGGVHREVLLRRALKSALSGLVAGRYFEAIVIEDAFVGENADTVRLLFALNTAIDELILDGVCSCGVFLRVSNQSWKSWLVRSLDTLGVTKGFNDKEKIRWCLENIGVVEEGKGYQDRLDSIGLLVSYFLRGSSEGDSNITKKVKRVRFSDIEASYEVDSGYLFYGRDSIDRSKIVFIDYSRVSKKKVIELLSDRPDCIFVTSSPVLLGNLGIELGLDYIEGGGYFAFWVRGNRLKKYL